MSCALGSIEHIEVVATIAAFVEHRDLGFQDRRAETFSTVQLERTRFTCHLMVLTHGAHRTSFKKRHKLCHPYTEKLS